MYSMSERFRQFETRSVQEEHSRVPVLVGRRELGTEMRKRFASTAKVDDPQHGLFLVAQGTGTELGAAVASRKMAEASVKELGETLDRMVDNNAQRSDAPQERASRMDALVRARLAEVFVPALKAIRFQGIIYRDLLQAGFRAAVAKFVKMPDDSLRLYVAHAGDVRVYVERNGNLLALTQDHSALREHKESGQISEEAYGQIDQAMDPEALPHEARALFHSRGEARFVGGEGAREAMPEVQAFHVAPGDRVVMVNAGVHHNLLKNELAATLASERDDAQAQTAIQQTADQEAGGKHPRARSVAADLACVVYTVDDCTGDLGYLRQEVCKPSATKLLPPSEETTIGSLEDELKRLRANKTRSE